MTPSRKWEAELINNFRYYRALYILVKYFLWRWPKNSQLQPAFTPAMIAQAQPWKKVRPASQLSSERLGSLSQWLLSLPLDFRTEHVYI